ncbi:MAG TPA: hypothetical protein VHC69_19505 [Polyangiaceae bacterium]|nr:hypothetical protein [Polyangiaceae bacterium]
MRTRRRWGAVVAVLCIARAAAAQGPAAPPAVTAPPSGNAATSAPAPNAPAPPSGSATTSAPAPNAPAPPTGAAPSRSSAAGFGSVQAAGAVPESASETEPPSPQGPPPPISATQGAESPAAPGAYGAAVPVWLTGEDGESADVEIYPDWATPGSVPPIARCRLPCGFQMPRGRYRLAVAETPNTLAGSRPVVIDGASRLVVTPRDRGTRTLGLVLGIGGIVAVVAGIGLMADGFHSYYTCDLDGPCTRTTSFSGEAGAGLALFLAGAALTPIGWVLFGKSFRPAVDVEHPGVGSAPRARVGVVPLRSGAGLGGSFVF